MPEISDLLKEFKLKAENITEEQVRDCFNNPELTGNSRDREVYAKTINGRILVITVYQDLFSDAMWVDGEISSFSNAEELYESAQVFMSDDSKYLGNGQTAHFKKY